MHHRLLRVLMLACTTLPAPALAQTAPRGIWIDADRLQTLPTNGASWRELSEAAHEPLPPPKIGDRDDAADVRVLAKALVYVRTGEARFRDEAVAGIVLAMGTESCGDVLALGRIVRIGAHAGHERRILQGRDGAVGDRAAQQLVGLVGRALAQGVGDARAIDEGRRDLGRVSDVGAVGARVLNQL